MRKWVRRNPGGDLWQIGTGKEVRTSIRNPICSDCPPVALVMALCIKGNSWADILFVTSRAYQPTATTNVCGLLHETSLEYPPASS